MVKIIKDLYPQLVVTGEPESKQIIIKTNKHNYQLLALKLTQLDAVLSQILIEVKVVEVSESELAQLGLI